MIELNKLTKWYGPIRAVDGIDLDIPKGQILGFLGPNGAGKTTTLRILTGFMPATSGSAKVNGCDVVSQSEQVRRNIGYLPESTPLYPELRVEEQLHFFGELHGLDRPTRRRRIDALADRCGLSAIRRRPIGQLSKGNRQRVGLAQAMLHDPPVLILDEPTVGLDPSQITEVRKLIVELGQEKTIVVSTHILPEVEKTCQRVVIISSGRIVAEGTPDELKSQVRSGARVLMEVRADADQAAAAIRQLEGVADVQVTAAAPWVQLAISATQRNADIRETLAAAVMRHQWPLRELRFEVASLEEFFVQITSEAATTIDEPGTAPTASAAE
jgi:ABC-2 type transport system ATP-binding protein